MLTKRKDSKGRILKDGETIRKDGRYAYQYSDARNQRHIIYSWRLTETDPQPKNKPKCQSLREMEKEIQKDLIDNIISRSKTTLNDRWDLYIANKPELKQSTRTNYKYLYNKYVREDIGKMPIQSIEYTKVKAFFNKLVHEVGFKPNSVESIQTILHPVFTSAIRDGLLRLNPTDGIINDLKKSNDWEKPKRSALTEKQQSLFMKYVSETKTYQHWYPIFICLFGTGCRVAEMVGLRWKDIDWKNNTISINHNLIYRLQEDGTVRHRITTPKTRSGTREIPMFKSVRSVLRKEYLRQKKEGFCTQVIDGYSGFVWMNQNGEVLTAHSLNRAIERIVKSYNKTAKEPLPYFTVHQMRHTFCCRLCENETDMKLIQEVMGHASIVTTQDIYNESNMDRKQRSFSRLETLNEIF